MKQWSDEIEINAPIDRVWSLFNGSLEQLQKIMPKVVENTPIKVTAEGVGSVYRQKYKEGKRVEEYDVHTLEFVDTENDKKLKVSFTLANLFEITALYELRRLDANSTRLKYTATNNPLKWFVKLFMIFGSSKVIDQFLEKVKTVAEEEAR